MEKIKEIYNQMIKNNPQFVNFIEENKIYSTDELMQKYYDIIKNEQII